MMGLFASILFRTLWPLDLHVYFLHQIREIFFHYFFKIALQFLALSLLLWHPCEANVGLLEVVPEAPYTFLILKKIVFPSCCSVFFFSFLMFQIIDLNLCFIHSTVDYL